MDGDVSSAEKRVQPATTIPARRRWRRLAVRLGFSLIVGLIALKIGDAIIGSTRDTHRRHLFRLAPNASMRHANKEFDYVFHTNSLGFRGPEVPFDKPEGTRRIVVIGDSFVAGFGVADDAVFTVDLEKHLQSSEKNVDVVNLGRTGSSTIREFDLYRAYGSRFSADDVVLIVFLGNDLAEVVEEHNRDELKSWHPQGWLRRAAYGAFPNLYLELAMARQAATSKQRAVQRNESGLLQELRNEAARRGVGRDQAEENYRSVPEEIRTAAINGRFALDSLFHGCLDPGRIERSLNPDDEFFARAWPRMTRHLAMLKSAVENDGARLKIVALPSVVQVEQSGVDAARRLGYTVDESWLKDGCRIETALNDWAKKHRVDYLDLTPALREAQQPVFHAWDRHLNDRGHAVLARVLSDWLQHAAKN